MQAPRAEQTRIELGPLPVADTQALVDQLLGAPGDAGLAAVRELVTQRAGGNPLFVEEILRSLAGAGVLQRQGERWVCGPDLGALDVPPTLYGLLLSRIDRLGAQERRTLAGGRRARHRVRCRAAAAHRQRADAGHRCGAGPVGGGRTAALRRGAAAAGAGASRHALLHEVAYQNLLLARRSELHGRAGRALEEDRRPAATPARAGWPNWRRWATTGACRPTRRAARATCWRPATGRARSMPTRTRCATTNAPCARWTRRPSEPDADAQPMLLLDAHERLAELLGLAGRRDEALAHYETVQQALPPGQEPVRAARVLRKIGGLHWEAGERERAGACFNAGLACLGEGGDAVERAHLFQELGRLAFRAGDNAGALAWSQRALDEVPAGDGAHAATTVRAEACNTLGVALARMGRPEEAVAHIERSVAQAEAHELLQAACRGYTNLGVLYATLDPQRSIETCLRGLETARKVGDLAFQSRLYANLAVAYCALTNRCEAEGIEAAQAAVALDRRLGLVDHLAVPLIVLGQIHQCHGDHARAFAAYNEALQLAEQVGRASVALSLLRWFGDPVPGRRPAGAGRSLARQGAGALRTRRPRARRADGASVPLLKGDST